MTTNFTEMSGPELVRVYNNMVEQAQELGLQGPRPVTRFPDLKTGVKRNEWLYSSLVAARQSQAVVAREDTPAPVPPPATEDQATTTGDTHEEEDMARRKVAKTKASANTRKRVNGSGQTIREITEEFNSLVPRANKKGLAWARHHSSLFESVDKGLKQLNRLKKELAA